MNPTRAETCVCCVANSTLPMSLEMSSPGAWATRTESDIALVPVREAGSVTNGVRRWFSGANHGIPHGDPGADIAHSSEPGPDIPDEVSTGATDMHECSPKGREVVVTVHTFEKR